MCLVALLLNAFDASLLMVSLETFESVRAFLSPASQARSHGLFRSMKLGHLEISLGDDTASVVI